MKWDFSEYDTPSILAMLNKAENNIDTILTGDMSQSEFNSYIEECRAEIAKRKGRKHIQLPYGIVIDLTDDGGGAISSCIKEVCEHCKDPDCEMDCPDFGEYCTDRDIDEFNRKRDERDGFVAYNGGVDAITSMILGHAIAGIDVDTPAYMEGIETAIQALGNNT